ncbi:hypothetical protein COLO4_29964 [Corchorus olitorius]|uniref:FHA domain-containing protein n=1 Tax=Corchorus olitorius TaxID=93759 RepID=A0A1R3HC73_9ROSI|nr:hypothetical protein COLO4_29964 [Corchorus olitorius]
MAEEKERKIPVFTVIKNGAILKNIFVINKPQEIEENEESGEILVVGRHPDCNIMLTHPSISRFHLQIHSKPSSQKLFVFDLSSVHGTWVSGKKIDPGAMVELNEGDSVKLGGSTRVYKLHWIPMSRAYDMENPFVSPMDVPMEEEDEEESSVKSHQEGKAISTEKCTDGKEEETSQSFAPAEAEELHSMDWILEGIVPLFSDESSELLVKKEIPSAPPIPIPENMNCSVHKEDENTWMINLSLSEMELLGPPQSELSSNFFGELSLAVGEVTLESQNQQFGKDNESILLEETVMESIPKGENTGRSFRKSDLNTDNSENIDPLSVEQVENYSATKIVEETENKKPLQESQQFTDISPSSTDPHLIESINSTLPEEDGLLNVKSQKVHKEHQTPPKPLSTWKPKAERENKENAAADQQTLLMNLDSTCSDGYSGKLEDAENLYPSRKDYESENTSFYSATLPSESVNSSFPTGELLSEIMDKRNPTPQSLFAPIMMSEDENLDCSPLRLEKKSNMHTIWSRRGKPASVLQIQTRRSTGKADAENKSISKSPFLSSEEEKEEIYTPEKENFTPNTLLMKALKLEETKHSSKVISSPGLQPEDDMIASDKENQTPKVIKELKSANKASRNGPSVEEDRMGIKGKAVRVPFQSLMVDSACKSVSETSVPNTTARSSNSNAFNFKTIDKRIGHPSLNQSVGEGRRNWTMVADATSLMDKESRKSLQLLQGLKGTRLIIPRMGKFITSIVSYHFITNSMLKCRILVFKVIRELDRLKRHGSLFRRTTEASAVLEWIEDCMLKTNWWIHVQSSMEEGGPVAPTPPATPPSHFSEGSLSNSFGTIWSARGSLMEMGSPTAEDHILDCALLFRKLKSDGQLVLLSNDVTLKIKAMAEGLICETAKEFRESLVNPFSERFMWADSSPRGQTWSVLDDVVLRDKYNRCPLKKPSKGDVKGLKLILLHNSHYKQISSVR